MRYGQLGEAGNGSTTANGMATTAIAMLMIVTDQSRSAPLRSTAFHAACKAAAKSTTPITAGHVAMHEAPLGWRAPWGMPWCGVGPRAAADTTPADIPT